MLPFERCRKFSASLPLSEINANHPRRAKPFLFNLSVKFSVGFQKKIVALSQRRLRSSFSYDVAGVAVLLAGSRSQGSFTSLSKRYQDSILRLQTGYSFGNWSLP
jgi:hypothetical protein